MAQPVAARQEAARKLANWREPATPTALVEESNSMADPSYPCRVRTYRNHLLDSTRWDRFLPRVDDVLISTSHKSGTTWMQRIVSLLVFGPGPLPSPLSRLSPWVDARLPSLAVPAPAEPARRSQKSPLAFESEGSHTASAVVEEFALRALNYSVWL